MGLLFAIWVGYEGDPAEALSPTTSFQQDSAKASAKPGLLSEWTESERRLRRAMVRSLINLQADLGPSTHVFVYREAGGWHIDTGGATREPTSAQHRRIVEILGTTLESFQRLSIQHPAPAPKRVLIIGPTYVRIVERSFEEVRPLYQIPERLEQLTIWKAYNIYNQLLNWVDWAIELYFDIPPVEPGESMVRLAEDVRKYLQGYARAYKAHEAWMRAFIEARRQVQHAPSRSEARRIEREHLARLESLATQHRGAYAQAGRGELDYQRSLYAIRQSNARNAGVLIEGLTMIAEREADFQNTFRASGATLESVNKLSNLHEATQVVIAMLDRIFPPPTGESDAIGRGSAPIEQSI